MVSSYSTVVSPVRVRFRAFTTRNSMRFSAATTIAAATTLAVKTADELIEHLKEYPDTRPGQKYVRTFALQRGWQASAPHFETSGLSVNVYNNAREEGRKGGGRYYAKYVQGAWQAPIHQGRWSRAEQGAESPDAFLNNLRREYRRELRGIIRSSISFVSR